MPIPGVYLTIFLPDGSLQARCFVCGRREGTEVFGLGRMRGTWLYYCSECVGTEKWERIYADSGNRSFDRGETESNPEDELWERCYPEWYARNARLASEAREREERRARKGRKAGEEG